MSLAHCELSESQVLDHCEELVAVDGLRGGGGVDPWGTGDGGTWISSSNTVLPTVTRTKSPNARPGDEWGERL